MTNVIRIGGSIGEIKNKVVASFEDHQEAKQYAKRMRSTLSRGEKSYYGLSFKTVKVNTK